MVCHARCHGTRRALASQRHSPQSAAFPTDVKGVVAMFEGESDEQLVESDCYYMSRHGRVDAHRGVGAVP
jgi:hypothetical protein